MILQKLCSPFIAYSTIPTSISYTPLIREYALPECFERYKSNYFLKCATVFASIFRVQKFPNIESDKIQISFRSCHHRHSE